MSNMTFTQEELAQMDDLYGKAAEGRPPEGYHDGVVRSVAFGRTKNTEEPQMSVMVEIVPSNPEWPPLWINYGLTPNRIGFLKRDLKRLGIEPPAGKISALTAEAFGNRVIRIKVSYGGDERQFTNTNIVGPSTMTPETAKAAGAADDVPF